MLPRSCTISSFASTITATPLATAISASVTPTTLAASLSAASSVPTTASAGRTVSEWVLASLPRRVDFQQHVPTAQVEHL